MKNFNKTLHSSFRYRLLRNLEVKNAASHRGILTSVVLHELPTARMPLLEVGDVINLSLEHDPRVVGLAVFANLLPHELLFAVPNLALRSLAHAQLQHSTF